MQTFKSCLTLIVLFMHVISFSKRLSGCVVTFISLLSA
uniref:Uncharacterized protein n=1 Tax=Arundo donax TaxID=35708 RepID=A0A0A9D8H4_ARUDO